MEGRIVAQGFRPGDDVTDLMNAAPVAVPHPEAKIGAPSPDAPVTLGDLRADPVAALKRVGAILGKDATDPKLWMGIAASYFGPKLFNAAAPVVARAASGVASGAIKVAPEIIKHGSTAAGAYVGGPAGAVIGRTVGESLAERMGPKPIVSPEPTGPVSTAGYPRLTVSEPAVATAPPPVQPSAPATPPPVAPDQATPAPAFNAPRLVPSPQKLARELGIAARRAGVTVTAADDVAVLQAVRGGADPAAAIADVIAAKAPTDPAAELALRFGLPSDAERTFPPNKSGLPTKPPKADAKAKIDAARARTK